MTPIHPKIVCQNLGAKINAPFYFTVKKIKKHVKYCIHLNALKRKVKSTNPPLKILDSTEKCLVPLWPQKFKFILAIANT